MKKNYYKINISRIIQELKNEDVEDDKDGKDNEEETSDEQKLQLPDYGSPEFWEKRYKIEFLPFDWYLQWNELEPAISSYITSDKEHLKSLVIGCGNSTMSNDMVEKSGYKNIVSIDISASVIEKMKHRYKNENLEWIQMDVADMKFQNDSFDLIFDKGTIDALTCSNDANLVIRNSSNELYRVLKPNGFLFMITFEKPIYRIPLMIHTKVPWKIETVLFIPNKSNQKDDDPGTYVYLFQKSN